MPEYYEAFAREKWGLIFSEDTYINESGSRGCKNQPSIANYKHFSEWSKIVDIVHKHNTLIFHN